MRSRHGALRAAALLLVLPTALVAQGTALVPIPERIPSPRRDSLVAERRRAEQRIDSVNIEIGAFNARCGQVGVGTPARAACEADLARLQVVAGALEVAKLRLAASVDSAERHVAAACPGIEAQLARDREQLRRQQGVNEAAVREIEDWARESEDAQRAALSVAVGAIFGEAATRLAARADEARALQRLLRQREAQLQAAGVNGAELFARLQRAERAYVSASGAAGFGRGYQALGEVDAALGLVRTEAAAVASFAELGDADLRTVLSSPRVRELTVENVALSEALRSILDHASATPQLVRFAPAYGLAALLVDYGYEAARWESARRAIARQHALTDLQLRAVDALSLQIRRTVEMRRVCRLP